MLVRRALRSGTAGRASAAGSRHAGQSGLTLIEVLIAIVLLSSIVVAGVSALFLSVKQSADIGHDTRTDVAINNFAEGIHQIPYLRERRTGAVGGCSATASGVTDPLGNILATGVSVRTEYTTRFRAWVVQAGGSGASSGFLSTASGTPISGLTAASFSITNVEMWDARQNRWEAYAANNSRCVASSSPQFGNPDVTDQGIQRVTLRVAWGQGGSQTRTIQVVKRLGAL